MLSSFGAKAPSCVGLGCSSSIYHRRLLASPYFNHTMPHSPILQSHVCRATSSSHPSSSVDVSFYATRPISCQATSTSSNTSTSTNSQRKHRSKGLHRHHKRISYIPHASARDPLSYSGESDIVSAADNVAATPPLIMEEPSTALLLAWFACGNRSLFAAQCLVEVVVELYREGRSFEEMQLSLKVASQGRQGVTATADGEVGLEMPLLQEQAEDVLISWLALVFLTLEELGVPRDKQPPTTSPLPTASSSTPSTLPPTLLGESLAGNAAGTAAALRLGAFGSAGVRDPAGGMAAGSTYLRGMLGYVRQTLGMYDEGQTLPRVAGLQGLVQQASSAASSPFLLLMQQYTRLVLLTVEVVAAAQLPTRRPLQPPGTVIGPSGYTAAFSGSCSALDLDPEEQRQERGNKSGSATTTTTAAQVAGDGGVEVTCPARGLAVRLLLAFMGAVLGSEWSREKFVEGVRVAYDQGLAADELFLQLDEREFLQSGGLLTIANPATASTNTPPRDPPTPVSQQAPPQQEGAATAGDAAASSTAAPAPAPQHVITKTLLNTWISLSYMTLAQLYVPYPDAEQRLGWAWAGFGDPIEAIGMNDFVGNVLRQMAGADPRAMPPPPPPSPTQDNESSPTSASTSDAPSSEDLKPGSSGMVSEAANAGDIGAAADDIAAEDGEESDVRQRGRRGGGVLMVRMEDEQLPVTSTAFRVLSQQVELVQAVCRQVVG